MSVTRSIVTGVGHYLPDRVVENSYYEQTLDTSDAWIRSRSGIERRRFAAPGELTSDLALRAAASAIAQAGLDPAAPGIDGIIVATSTPDNTFPATAARVQAGLGLSGGFAFDIQAVCAGFVYALANADALIRAGLAQRVLVAGAETFSRILDFSDRSTCVLFGDGAGAVIVEAAPGTGGAADRGVLAADLNSDGRYRDLLYVDGGVSSTGTAGQLRMAGREVFRHAIEKLADTAEAALAKAGLCAADIDWLVPHQANLRIITGTAQRAGIPMEKVVVTVADHGNTSAASIPLALSVAVADGRIGPGDLILTEAIGGGLVWGAIVLRW
jgi:3-oxoacyl-[acyl-carrier-protein] synthase-3